MRHTFTLHEATHILQYAYTHAHLPSVAKADLADVIRILRRCDKDLSAVCKIPHRTVATICRSLRDLTYLCDDDDITKLLKEIELELRFLLLDLYVFDANTPDLEAMQVMIAQDPDAAQADRLVQYYHTRYLIAAKGEYWLLPGLSLFWARDRR